MPDTIRPCGYAVRNGPYAPAMIPNGYFRDMTHLCEYMTAEANMRDDLRAHHYAEALISIYPAEEVMKEGRLFPLVRQVPGSKAYVHYIVHRRSDGTFRWFPLD